MHGSRKRWVARLKPMPDSSIELLLGMPLGLDIWERNNGELIVAASEAQLKEIERRCLAHVERLSTTEDFVDGAQRHADL